jgi:hypothetical protein
LILSVSQGVSIELSFGELQTGKWSHHVEKNRFRSTTVAVAVPESEVSAIPAVKGKFGQRPRGKLVRDNELRNGRHACAGFDDAPHRVIGRQFHDDAERGRIDASAAQDLLEGLARAGPFLAEHPACREQMVTLDSRERSEFV